MSLLRQSLARTASGWRAVCLIAATYVYFLIFAQFAFLNRLGEFGIADANLKIVMAAMALGGISFSLLASTKLLARPPRALLQLSFAVCAASAASTLLPLTLPASVMISCLIGCGLGLLTVTLVANLPLWLGSSDGLISVGLGTGIGYFICNIPQLFTAPPSVQALTAALLCLIGLAVADRTSTSAPQAPLQSASLPTFALVLAALTALVWLDSAAFFIIQSTPDLKAGTWAGTIRLWANGSAHLAAALASAFLLRRRGLTTVLVLAVALLAIACLLLHLPQQSVEASLFYAAGVSFYSVALIAYPALLTSTQSAHARLLRAGIIYAVAGWFGSAMGIGMGQHLHQVPLPFVLLACSLIIIPGFWPILREHRRESATLGVVMGIALALQLATSPSKASTNLSAVERGRQVYISEGCINCHSQYVRPGSSDNLMWGPAETVEELHAQHPPLIGNRRQGPDLSQVGGRRSPLWLKAHFFNPSEISHASFMPSYAYLFQYSERGDDLVQYLSSLRSPAYPVHIALEQAWHPSATASAAANLDDGAHLFGAYCVTCHQPTGATRLAWAASFKRLPPDLQHGPWLHIQPLQTDPYRTLQYAQIVKFGIPGTDMPGHEYLSDQDVASIALWLNQSMVLPPNLAVLKNPTGDTP